MIATRSIHFRPLRFVALLTAVFALLIPSVASAAGKHAASGKAAVAKAHTASNSCQNADVVPGQAPVAQIQTATLCLMNAERTARGLKPLRSQATLAQVAGSFAQQMADQHFFDHVSPNGSTLLSRVKGSSYLTRTSGWSLGENIAWATDELSTPRATVQAWMKSPPHRANLLAGQFTEVGIGIAAGGAPQNVNPDNLGTTYVTNFGLRGVKAGAAKAARR